MRGKMLTTLKRSVLIMLVLLSILLSACGMFKNEKEDRILITTIPLYVDRILYKGDSPLCYYNDVLMIPLKALEIDEPDTSSSANKTMVDAGDGNQYVYIPNFSSWYVSADEIDMSEEYDYYFYETDTDSVISIRKGKQSFNYGWTKGRVIAHALGGIDGIDYTNSLEAFLYNYEIGHRVFEVDFCLNSRYELLCIHDFSEEMKYFEDYYLLDNVLYECTKEEFLHMQIYGKYHTLSIDELIELMYNYPDVYIVTDTKSDDEESSKLEFATIVETAKRLNKAEVLDRIIPQIHNEKMYSNIMSIYDWKSIIYTSYFLGAEDYSEERMFEFAYDNGIKVITLFKSRGTDYFLEKCKQFGIKTYVHTYNTEEERKELYEKGFYGLYTDFLMPDTAD